MLFFCKNELNTPTFPSKEEYKLNSCWRKGSWLRLLCHYELHYIIFYTSSSIYCFYFFSNFDNTISYYCFKNISLPLISLYGSYLLKTFIPRISYSSSHHLMIILRSAEFFTFIFPFFMSSGLKIYMFLDSFLPILWLVYSFTFIA